MFILQRVNPGGISVGRVLKVPLNSAGAYGGSSVPVDGGLIRVTIPTNSNTATLLGVLAPQGVVRYIVQVGQNAILNVKVTTTAGEIAMRVYQQNGGELKAKDTTLTWSGTITNAGDYVIELTGVAGTNNKTFTLEISIVPPVS